MARDILRKVFSFPVALGSIVVLWVCMGASYSVWDADIWWHLRNAGYLFTHLKFPATDMYSFTAAGHPWLNHEWLAEVPYYLAWRAGGVRGLYALFLSLLIVIHLAIFYWASEQSRNLKAAFLVGCSSVFLTKVSFGPRTILFGYIFIILLLLILSRYRATGKAPLWVLPPLFCLWINTHGSWLLGLFLLGVYIVTGLVAGSWGRIDAVRWTPQQLRRLLLAAGASVAALFVNPFTYRLVYYPFDLIFRQKLNIQYVDEWASVDFSDARGKVVLVLLAVILLGALLSPRHWRLEEVALGAFALYAGLIHIRFLFLAAILLAPILAKLLDFIPPYRPEIDKPPLNAVVCATILLIVVSRFPTRADLDTAVAQRYPANALNYVKAHALEGNFFNRYMWGGYMILFHPELKTFIDGRTDIFEYTGVLKDYLDAELMKGSLQILDKYRIHYVLTSPELPMSYLLSNTPGWKMVFRDQVTMIFERSSTCPEGLRGSLPARSSVQISPR
ncbi:MAG: hypothetical protein LAO07_04695 [Acidobacteriia bacterium]|nr:hypothetical protein [Terriglobia bacterium]